MEIIGRGMIAHSLLPYQTQLRDVVAFASGVSVSSPLDPSQYEREYDLLYDTLKRCRSARKRLLYFSSGGAIYGDLPTPRAEDSPLFPQTAYGRHKLLCEAIIRHSGARHLIVRLPNLVGTLQNSKQLIPALAEQLRRGHVRVYEHATRDLLDIDDFARILVRLVAVHDADDLIVIASGQSVAIPDMVMAMQELLGTSAALERLPRGDIQQFDITHLQQLLPDETRFAPDYYHTILRKYLHHL